LNTLNNIKHLRCILGIDPGLSGAIALYDPDTGDLDVWDMPVHAITVNGKKKNQLDLYQLGTLIDTIAPKVKMAFIEAVHSLPAQGVTSSFNFGFAAGAAQGAVAANLIPMTLVAPATWKRAMRLTADKDVSRQRASQLMPKHAKHWPLVKHDGRAEAALLAWYGANQN